LTIQQYYTRMASINPMWKYMLCV